MSDRAIRVLLVEDDADDRLLARELLADVKGARYELECASTAAEGRERIARREHDVYLVDYQLGDALGVDLVREAIAAGGRAPFVMFTGMGDEDVALEALQAGAADYLVKGEITPSTLHRAIRYALERARSVEGRRVIEEQERALRARDAFIAVAAHELRNPLTALQFSIESLKRSFGPEAPPRARERLAGAEAQTRRLVELVARLLDVSHLTEGKLPLVIQDVDLAAVVRAIVADHAPEASRAGSRVAVEGDEQVRGSWDPVRLAQLVRNLLSNAINYGEGKPIEVRVATEGEEAVLVVRDHGQGIDPRDRERIFDRFERATTLRNVGGLGVGLWIVREVVSALGGTIALASEAGAGATFTVRLPLQQAASQEQKRATVPSSDSSGTGFSR